MKIVQEYTK